MGVWPGVWPDVWPGEARTVFSASVSSGTCVVGRGSFLALAAGGETEVVCLQLEDVDMLRQPVGRGGVMLVSMG
jgi:hypothetical protein